MTLGAAIVTPQLHRDKDRDKNGTNVLLAGDAGAGQLAGWSRVQTPRGERVIDAGFVTNGLSRRDGEGQV